MLAQRRSPSLVRALRAGAFAALVLAVASPALARDDDEEEPDLAMPMKMEFSFDADLVSGELGATPGGAQDIAFFRDRVAAGEVPHPDVFTPEGLFSEHDLPLTTKATCGGLLCVNGQATDVALLAQPEVRYLAQLGFASNLNAATFQRDPLNLVAVIDKSGSMSGQPLELVKESLIQVVSQLRDEDQLTVVLYGDQTHVHLPTSRIGDAASRRSIKQQLAAIESAGSTYMEAGLALAFEVARETAPRFQGTTRVMLFTDERPNVGRTDAESFMGMAEAASRDGIGMTTIGVGVQFGAELATRIASVRGGNLFFFPHFDRMKSVFSEELDTMITELAYDLQLELHAGPGLAIAGVYGIPGEALEWTDDGGLRLTIATIFLSRRKGAIYVGLKAADPHLPLLREAQAAVLQASLAYVDRAGTSHARTEAIAAVTAAQADVGLQRGAVLVNEATALKAATELHHVKNDQEGAYQLVHALASELRANLDEELANERALVQDLERTLAKLSGHAGEPAVVSRSIDGVTGLPTR